MKGWILMLLTVALCACSSTTEKYTAEGTMVYAISCQLQSVDSCVEKAGELCGSLGYHFVLPDGTPGPSPLAIANAAASVPATETRSVNKDAVAPATAPAATSTTTPPPAASSAGNVLNRKFYVRCRPGDAT